MSKLEGVKEVAGSNPVVYVFDQELRRPLKCAPPPPAPRERRKSGRGKEAEGRTPRGRRERCLESVLKLAEYNQRDLVQHWKNQSSGRRKKAIPRQTLPDEMAMEAFGLNLDRWLQERLLQDTLERDARWDPPASEGDPSYPSCTTATFRPAPWRMHTSSPKKDGAEDFMARGSTPYGTSWRAACFWSPAARKGDMIFIPQVCT